MKIAVRLHLPLRRLLRLALLLPALAQAPAQALPRTDYSTQPRAQTLYATLRADYGFSESEIAQVRRTLAQAQRLPQLIPTEQNNKETTSTWEDYRPIAVNARNIANGRRFMAEQHVWLARAEAEYGVPPQIITAILGFETQYGANPGRYRALDTLATLGFEHPRRADFFFSELTQLFVLCRRDRLDPGALKSSYAGALGDTQFMPSNYLKLGIDYDHDGRVDLWNPADAIGSIANYLVRYRPAVAWQRGQPVYVKVSADEVPAALPRNALRPDSTAGALAAAGIRGDFRLPSALPAGLVELRGAQRSEYWLALPNFFSILSYNPRVFYAAAVAALADALVQDNPQQTAER